ncbi:Di-copper centre-containing protein [Coniochaeta ligniaria NRRL 30616]|uniref:Di-copper centre-containing protein n=1 Tax=Coniochaeta ligniaria NRRL 30616 TaxID=1408157 RepID=A0A1J7I5P1_9PEZI|nr:Di-copper centre-containing protein [Coniochaeta ligniaria NRRL 30616]
MMFSPLRTSTALLLLSAISAPVTGYTPASTAETDVLAALAAGKLALYYTQQRRAGNHTSCTLENVAVRREWSTLSSSDRIAYTNAVNCLMSKPSLNNASEVPGAKSRFDDFVAVHINQTLFIHGTANFLSWHRFFTWTYEQALRNECGYTGYQPYWNWGKSAFDPIHSPYFDGTPTSVGGNGVFEPHNCTSGLPTGLNCIPPGEGGGCVTAGPFANMSVNMGPISPTLAEPDAVPASSLYAYNPRCLKRDVSSWVSSRWTTDRNSSDLIARSGDIVAFQTTMQGDFASGVYGVHTGGHFVLGGDPGGDLFASPGDPAFYLHHAQIDRTWWVWQNLDPEERTRAIGGSISLLDPTARNGTLEDVIDLGVNAEAITIEKVMSTVGLTGGPLCYVYV